MIGLSRKRVFPKTKGDSITGQDRAQKHCDFRFSQIEKKSKVAVLQLYIMDAAHRTIEIGEVTRRSSHIKGKDKGVASDKRCNIYSPTLDR